MANPRRRGSAAARDVVVVVRGTVQGVGFRWWARRRLASLGLDGTAENLDDGTVRITARGSAGGIGELLDELHGGAAPGHVTGVDVRDHDDDRTAGDGPVPP